MELDAMIPFIPKTNNVNGDRQYFVDGAHFIKMDENFSRGRHEADMLTLLGDSWYTPRLIATFDRPGFHCLRMDLVPGDTMENLKGSMTPLQKRIVVQLLLRIVEDMMFRGIVHGDLNESNVLFDPESHRVTLIDWETARVEDTLQDVYGPPWGLLDLLEKLR